MGEPLLQRRYRVAGTSGCSITNSRSSPERFDAPAEFGGFDGIVLWHAYPIIGVDDRNQFDYYRDARLATLVAELRRRGLRVFINYNPWDAGTRRELGGDEALLASLVTELGVDGLFLDTMHEGGHQLVEEMRRLDPPPVLEGSLECRPDRIGDHQMSWAQWFADSPAPGVMAAHWLSAVTCSTTRDVETATATNCSRVG